ncbi:MAG: AMP-binding protein, partial [Planctomycetales bacterium]|nr:AMP-binding protein [Planctomycetales bacterium]
IRWRSTDQWFEEELAAQWRRPDVHGETLAFLQYTSGSTGTPKGVMLNHANLMHNSAMITYAFEHSRSGSGCFWLPLYHDMGLIGGLLQPIYMGRPNTLFSPTHFLQKPVRWLQAVSQSGATISGGPNFAYDLCVEKVTAEQKRTLDLSRWSLAFNGAEPVRADTMRRFADAFAECGFRYEAFYPCYGLAEATLIVAGGYKQVAPVVQKFDIASLEQHRVVSVERETEGARALVGSGGNLLDQTIVIADPETLEPCGENEVGEVWVNGPSVAQGYWRRPEQTQETFQARLANGRGPFLRTGDLGFLREGELFVTGRLKDLIILRGVNYYPQDIEASVESAHQGVKIGAGAAFTVGEEARERLVIVQETVRRRDLDFGEIIDAIRRKVAQDHEVAVEAVVLLKTGSIPKTSSGKIQRHACVAGYQAGTLAALATWSTETGKVEIAPSVRRRRDDDATLDSDGMEAAADSTYRPAESHNGSIPKAAPRRESTSQTAGSAPKASTAQVAQHILDVVYDRVRAVGRERVSELAWDTNIVELGLDSLERMEIVASLEEAFGGRFPEHVLAEMETCGEVALAIETHMGGALREPQSAPADYQVDPQDYVFAQSPEYRQLQANLEMATGSGLPNPYFTVHEGITNDRTQIDGQEYINFCSYNYLG